MIKKKEVIIAALDLKYKTFIVYIALFISFNLNIHLSYRPQVFSLVVKKAFIKMPT